MKPIRERQEVRANISSVSSQVATIGRKVAYSWPVNFDDGASGPTRMREPFSVRPISQNGFNPISKGATQYRTQASVGEAKYFAYQTTGNWMIRSEDLPSPIDLGISSEYDIFLQPNGEAIMIYAFNGSVYESFSMQGSRLISLSATALSSTDAAFSTLNSGQVIAIDGNNLYLVGATAQTIDTFGSVGSSFAIEAIGSTAIVGSDRGGIVFNLVDSNGIISTFTGGPSGNYVFSSQMEGAAVFCYETSGNYSFYFVNSYGVYYSFTITASSLLSEGIPTREEVVYVWVHWAADKLSEENAVSVRFITKTVTPDQASGKYTLYSRIVESTSPSSFSTKEIIGESDAAIYGNPNTGSVDGYTLSSSSLVKLDNTNSIDLAFFPSTILRPMSGGAISKGDAHFTHAQDTLSSVWTIPHFLEKQPAVQVYDEAGNPVYPEKIVHDTLNQTSIYFAGFSYKGKAELN